MVLVRREPTKLCPACGREKPLFAFNRDKNRSKGVDTFCKSCKRQKRASLTKSKQEYKQQYQLSHPCVDCGEKDPVVLQFDHVIGIKKKSIADLVGSGCGLKTLIDETMKCVSRCANCHQRKTYYENITSGRFTGVTHV